MKIHIHGNIYRATQKRFSKFQTLKNTGLQKNEKKLHFSPQKKNAVNLQYKRNITAYVLFSVIHNTVWEL